MSTNKYACTAAFIKVRTDAGLTVKQLAALSRCSEAYIVGMETEDYHVSTDVWKRLCHAMKVDPWGLALGTITSVAPLRPESELTTDERRIRLVWRMLDDRTIYPAEARILLGLNADAKLPARV